MSSTGKRCDVLLSLTVSALFFSLCSAPLCCAVMSGSKAVWSDSAAWVVLLSVYRDLDKGSPGL